MGLCPHISLSPPPPLKEEFSLFQRVWDSLNNREKVNKHDTKYFQLEFKNQNNNIVFTGVLVDCKNEEKKENGTFSKCQNEKYTYHIHGSLLNKLGSIQYSFYGFPKHVGLKNKEDLKLERDGAVVHHLPGKLWTRI